MVDGLDHPVGATRSSVKMTFNLVSTTHHQKSMNCLLIGSESVGKTSLIHKLSSIVSPDGHDPTIEDKLTYKFQARGEIREIRFFEVHLDILELEFRRYLRVCPVVLLVYSVSDRNSFEIVCRWLGRCRGKRVYLVGHKADLVGVVDRRQALKLCLENNLMAFETSVSDWHKLKAALVRGVQPKRLVRSQSALPEIRVVDCSKRLTRSESKATEIRFVDCALLPSRRLRKTVTFRL